MKPTTLPNGVELVKTDVIPADDLGHGDRHAALLRTGAGAEAWGFGATVDDAMVDALAELRYDLEDEHRAAMDKTYTSIERETIKDVHEEWTALGLVALGN